MATGICIKGMLGKQAEAYLASGVSRKEAMFYRELAASLGKRGLVVPRARYCGIDPINDHGLIIMDDLVAAGCEFLSPLTPYTQDEARCSLTQLARLHACSGTAAIYDQPWIEPMLDRIAADSMVPLERVQLLLEDSRSDAFPSSLRDARRVHGAIGLLAEKFRHEPVCCVHGDAHAGNLFHTADRQDIGIIDWQLIQRGHWAQDVAYHLGAALSVEDRRDSERALLNHYVDRLAEFGGPIIDRELGWTQYRMAMLYGYYLWAITQRVDRPIILEFMKRLGSAVVDLDSLKLVES
jgi:aminoglycoside/choline kinase family phosphotransferase